MKDDILSRPPLFDYFEEMPQIDSDAFDKVIRARRSVRVFKKEPIDDSVIEKVLEHGLLAPNSSNLQSWKFVWIRSDAAKALCVKACLNQSAARTAQGFIVAVARTRKWPEIKKEMISKLKENDAPKSALAYYEKIVPFVYNQGFLGIFGMIKRIILFLRGLKTPTPRGPVSMSDMRVWAHKTCALACENMMLSLVAQGCDSCPMEGFDENLMKKSFPELLEKGDEICMILGYGKRDHGGIFGPQVRMDSSRFIDRI